MRYQERVPKELIKDGHYTGRPADFEDRIVRRRVDLVRAIEGFCGKEKELLDIGCGNGATMSLLAGEMKSCLGMEIETTHQAEFERYKKERRVDNCAFMVFDVENQPFDKTFDRLISFEVIEHLRDDRNVKRFYELLKPGGVMAITVPNKWWIFETHGARLPLLPWNRVPFFSWLPRPLHERFANARIYTKYRIVKLLRRAGFEIVSTQYITAPMDVLKDGKLKRFLLKHIFNTDTTKVPFLSTSIMVVATKRVMNDE